MMQGRDEDVRNAEELRGEFFTDLDRLAFALEMEGVERLAEGDEAAVLRLENQRLGVRLAQRLVAGVWADEVNLRMQHWRAAYESRTRSEEKVEAK